MSKRRLSEEERRQAFFDARAKLWPAFISRLRGVETIFDAQLLHKAASRPDTPDRAFYANLGHFLITFTVPAGSNAEERAEYRRLLVLWEASGIAKAGSLARFDASNASTN